jgi:type II secretory pathway component PulF
MSMLLNAGVSVREAISLLASGSEQSAGPFFRHLRKKVESGLELSNVLGESGSVFTVHDISLIRVGEVSGRLDVAFHRLSDHLDRQDKLRRKVRSAMVYPAVVLSIATLAVAFLLAFIVPVFAEMYRDFDRTLPLPTQWVMGFSDWLVGDAWAYILIILGMIFGIRSSLRRNPAWNIQFDAMMLRIPVLGNVNRLRILSLYFRSVQNLLGNGVGLIEASGISAKGIVNTHAALRFRNIVGGLSKGKAWTDCLKRTGFVSGEVLQITGVGENTGNLGLSCRHAADLYETELEETINRMLVFLEPAIILVLGAVVAFILISMYLPMMEVVTI